MLDVKVITKVKFSKDSPIYRNSPFVRDKVGTLSAYTYDDMYIVEVEYIKFLVELSSFLVVVGDNSSSTSEVLRATLKSNDIIEFFDGRIALYPANGLLFFPERGEFDIPSIELLTRHYKEVKFVYRGARSIDRYKDGRLVYENLDAKRQS